MELLSPERIGWVAGLVDLRGYLSDRPSSAADRRLPTVAVTLTDGPDRTPSAAIRWLCEHSGVAPIPTGKGYNRSGCSEHCPDQHVHVSNTYHRWIVGGAKATVVLRAVLPLLLLQADTARRLLGYQANFKHAHFNEMREYGWPA